MQELNLGNGGRAHSLTLRDLLTIAFRHRLLIAISFLGILSGSILVALLQPNRYATGMKILVKRERVDPVVTAEASALPQFALGVTEEDMNSEVALLKSRDLLEKVVVACDLQHRHDSAWFKILAAVSAKREDTDVERNMRIPKAVRALEEALSVEVLKKTNLIALSYESPDPKLAAQVLTELSNLYLEKHLEVHRPPGALDFFQQQTKEYRKGLSDAEERLVNFTHGGTVVSAKLEKEVTLQKLAEFDAALRQTRASIAETQERIRALQEQMVFVPARMVTQVRNADDGMLLSQFRAGLLTLELKRTELLGKFESSYRPVQEIETQITQTRAALAVAEKSQLHEETTDRDPTHEWVRGELAKAKSDLAGLQARAEATSLAVQSYRTDARWLERNEVIQDDLIRSVKATEENYLLYRRKEEEARISAALDRKRIINVAIAEAATVPSLPSSHRSLTLAVGLLLATAASLGLAFGSDYLDPTFRTPDEVASFLNIPVLAAVPQNGKNGKNGTVGENGVHGKNGAPAKNGDSGTRHVS
jgi:uncharacterized protein involved in exopolysaccharide biosynthesis